MLSLVGNRFNSVLGLLHSVKVDKQTWEYLCLLIKQLSFYHIPLMVYNMTWSLDLLPSFKTVLHR